ncbi:hypothetical protein CLIM01_14545 [Colletotrichum limetticola]|uniref:Uncharacterized protein n=1 Tax=Colletotrichum limetticola TaxID=1209924 RepID=A0ABQ9P7J7_9PEZI|nr:hypothetical protein CLIM01_14545 [Colletotrichum limetticola]
MYHPRPRHNQEPGALLAQQCGSAVLSTRCNRRLTSLLRGHRYVRFVPQNQLREDDGGRVLAVFTLVVQRWFGLSTTSGSKSHPRRPCPLVGTMANDCTVVCRPFAHLLLLAGARVETRTTGDDRRCLSCQSSTRFPISAPYQCAIDGGE